MNGEGERSCERKGCAVVALLGNQKFNKRKGVYRDLCVDWEILQTLYSDAKPGGTGESSRRLSDLGGHGHALLLVLHNSPFITSSPSTSLRTLFSLSLNSAHSLASVSDHPRQPPLLRHACAPLPTRRFQASLARDDARGSTPRSDRAGQAVGPAVGALVAVDTQPTADGGVASEGRRAQGESFERVGVAGQGKRKADVYWTLQTQAIHTQTGFTLRRFNLDVSKGACCLACFATDPFRSLTRCSFALPHRGI